GSAPLGARGRSRRSLAAPPLAAARRWLRPHRSGNGCRALRRAVSLPGCSATRSRRLPADDPRAAPPSRVSPPGRDTSRNVTVAQGMEGDGKKEDLTGPGWDEY